jgi:hypothetical protein
MAINPYVGWGITTILSMFLNKSSSSSTSSEPSDLSAETADLGTPVPVVFGRQIVKNPLTIYYGDFKSKIYTETYAAHAKFSAWPIILSALAVWASTLITGKNATKHVHKVTTSHGAGSTTSITPDPIPTKEIVGPQIIMLFATWLLNWLINGRNLKTTIQKGFKYYLGYQMLCCVSGHDIRLRGLYIGYDANSDSANNGAVWTGNISREDHLTKPYVIRIDNDELFGGPDENGGFIGDIKVYLGGATQPADPWMIEQMSAESVQEELRGLTPAYRPFVSIVVPTAYIGKQASIPATYLDIQWIPNRLGLGGIGENDANPAEIIYELHVNKEWGLGRDPSELDIDSLIALGIALKKEGHGVSVKISNKPEAKELIDNLCNHLDMVRFVEPSTGKLVFRLIRDDYDRDCLPIIDSSIVSAIDFTRTVWSSSAGEIVAKYSDSSSLYNTSTVMENDPAIIEANNGDRNSQDVDFSYFTTSENASWAANRELRQKGFPLASVKLTCNRKVHAYRPGDVFKLNWAPYGISNLVMRVSDVDLGDFISGEITIEAIEDVFGVGKTTYGADDTTSWKPPATYPTGVQLFRYMEAPWELQQSKESYVYALANQPNLITDKWSIWREKDLSWLNTNAMIKWTPTAYLMGSLPEDSAVEDIVGFEISDRGGVLDLALRNTASGMPYARNGTRLLIVGNEIMSWGTISQLANGNFKLSNILRGTYDTVPSSHSACDLVFFIDNGYYANVTTGGPVCPEGTTVSERYNITTSTAYAEEPFDNTKVTALTTVRRAERPTVPGRIRLSSHRSANAERLTAAAGDIQLSWANRNKLYANGCVSQDDITDYYTGMATASMDGVQTLIKFYIGAELISTKVVDQIVSEESMPETPTSATLSWAQRCLDKASFSSPTRLEIVSKINGLESYQSHKREFAWKPPFIVDACETEEDALAIMGNICTKIGAVVYFENNALNKTVAFESMPLIILGTAYNTVQVGAVLAQNGKYVVPNGLAVAIASPTTYNIIALEAGYIALSYLSPYEEGKLVAYQHDGALLNQIAVPDF